LLLAGDWTTTPQPRQLFTLSGACLQVQPEADDTAFSLQERVAHELRVPQSSVKILHECLLLPANTRLADLSCGDLQIVVDRREILRSKLEKFEASSPEASLVDKFYTTIEIQSGEELNIVVLSITKLALEQGHLVESCARAAAAFHRQGLEFPPSEDDTKPVTPQRLMLNALQDKFQDAAQERQRFELEPMLKYFCHLFSVGLLSENIICKVIDELELSPTHRVAARGYWEALRLLAQQPQHKKHNRQQVHIQIAATVEFLVADLGC